MNISLFYVILCYFIGMFLALLLVARRTSDSLLRSADNRVLCGKRGRYLKKTLRVFLESL